MKLKQKSSKIGIYKITSPNNKVYIGQAVDIEDRKKHYRLLHNYCIGPKIYNSLLKYGWEAHKHELIEECLIENLDEREEFHKTQFIEQFGWKKALFCQIKDSKGGYRNKKTKAKISKTWQNKSQKELEIINEKRRIGNLGKKKPGAGRGKYTKKEKIALGKRSYYKSKEFLDKLRKPILQLDKINLYLIKEFHSITQASKENNIKQGDISKVCSGKQKTAGGYIWKYKENLLN